MSKTKHFGLKLCVISDTHLYKPILPAADILIHCGDLTNTGTLEQMMLMNNWFQAIKPNYPKGILYVPGNHDWLPCKNITLAEVTMSACKILHDQEVTIDGCVFYGTSWQPQFMNWAFNVPEEQLEQEYARIPYYTDVLITHTPPFGILDQSVPGGEHLGSEALSDAIAKVHPRLSVFGHIHGSYGIAKIDETTYANAAVCSEKYDPINEPIVIEI